jgi:anti-sigma factor RsiW
MICHDLELDIGDYVDGTLDAADVARVDAHLRQCPSCRSVVEDLRLLRSATRSLEPDTPPAHLWPRIATAVETDSRLRSMRRLFSFGTMSWQPLLAGAVMLVLLAGGAWVSWRNVSSGTRTEVAPSRNTSDVVAAIEPVDEQMQAAEQHYTRVIASLEQIAQTERTSLDTPMAAVVDKNLAVIDQAIGESREALRQEPASDLAQQSLFEALRSKVTLLQETIALINEMRKGNQEGAARIVSGLNQ